VEKIILILILIPILMVVEISWVFVFYSSNNVGCFYSSNNILFFHLKVVACFPLILPYYEHVFFLCQAKVCVVMVLHLLNGYGKAKDFE
jgi:hypothetical protein